MHHNLKIWPQYFDPVFYGKKTFEVRNNDRAFQKGDAVTLHEWNPEEVEKCVDSNPREDFYEMVPKGYTGRKLDLQIGYVLPIDDKRVVFSLIPIGFVKTD